MTENEHVKLGAYHTLEIEQQRPFTIYKQSWDALDLERIQQACDPAASADLAAVLITVQNCLSCMMILVRNCLSCTMRGLTVLHAGLAWRSKDNGHNTVNLQHSHRSETLPACAQLFQMSTIKSACARASR